MSSTNKMLHSRFISQLVCLSQQHVTCDMLKLLCVSCKHSGRSNESRRQFQTNDHDDRTMEGDIEHNARILWNYLRIDNPLKKSDLILLLGNSDLRTADYAAKLYKDGFAPKIAVSGKEGHNTRGKWNKPEAVMFAESLQKHDVPSSDILVEPKATNTGENIRFTQQLLQNQPDLHQPQSVILIQTPFMGRRSLATFLKQWENADKVDVRVTSPPIPLNQYASQAAGYGCLKDIAEELVRNLYRIQHYPSQGFQVPQHIPSHVLEASTFLQYQLKQTDWNQKSSDLH